MSPRSTITTPPEPLLPRQTYNPNDPYDLSSLYSELSVLYPDAYSSLFVMTDDAAMRSYYSSLLKSYSLTDYGYGLTTGSVRPGTTTKTSARATATGALSAATTNTGEETPSSGGLSTGAKAGIGVGVAVGILLLAGLGICLWCMGKRKGKKSSTTVVAPAQPNFTFQPQPTNPQGYTPGNLQQQHISPSSTHPPQPQVLQPPGSAASYGGYEKGPGQDFVELEHEYHFARPGVVEIGDGREFSTYPPK
ncbi:hypothetical protein DM02DRAFT_649685 [Periconia macrospinosa]|uniref:Mid2 domain-containing protein n=1 Tax=Periconia macrospinosa TaxID=97972 RepID=A0A2V1E7L1_9PLEO|nr:hypothetical protein DM02DRAFT_649685 [Periconia macrospinosa]